ncbi:portal protein, partial [Lacticaseibacillus paracasei]
RLVSVLNVIFIPRLSGSNQTTEIKQLPGDENIDKIRDLEYFCSDLIEKSIVPKQRLTANQSFSLGKSNELSREESIFHKQIEGLRQRFADLFHETIKRDLI